MPLPPLAAAAPSTAPSSHGLVLLCVGSHGDGPPNRGESPAVANARHSCFLFRQQVRVHTHAVGDDVSRAARARRLNLAVACCWLDMVRDSRACLPTTGDLHNCAVISLLPLWLLLQLLHLTPISLRPP